MQQPLTKKRSEAPPTLGSPDKSSGLINEYSGSSKVRRLSAQLAAYDVRQVVLGLSYRLKALRTNEARFKRALTHSVAILVVGLAVGLNQTNIFQWQAGPIRPLTQDLVTSPELAAAKEAGSLLTLPTELDNLINGVLNRAAVPNLTQSTDDIAVSSTETGQPQNEGEIIIYEVEPGDTIFAIAAKFGLAPETIMWSNVSLGDNPDLLQVGQELIILPEDGVYHQVGGGDTVAGIASTFRTDPAGILNHPLNELDPEQPLIVPGQWLIVPGGTKPYVPRTVTAYTGTVPEGATFGTGSFDWPSSGSIYNGYWSAHPGIDIAAWVGAPVLAADSGYVLAVGWDNTGYGNSIVIDHGNGFQTLYAHLNAFYVNAGDNVAKGQQIGEMGNTGNSTGPHLHFEVRQGTVQRNPVGFLP